MVVTLFNPLKTHRDESTKRGKIKDDTNHTKREIQKERMFKMRKKYKQKEEIQKDRKRIKK